MARRARPRGHIEERPGGKLRVRVYAGRDPLTGSQRYLKKTIDNEKQAEAALTKLLNQVDEQRHPRTQVTVRQVIAKWFEVRGPRGDHPHEERATRSRLHRAVTREDASRRSSMRNCSRPSMPSCANAGSSATAEAPQTTSASHSRKVRVRQIHAILRGSLDRAVRWQYISVNPAALAAPPGLKPPQPDPPSPEEAAAVLNEAWPDPAWGILLWLVMVTGCRRRDLPRLTTTYAGCA